METALAAAPIISVIVPVWRDHEAVPQIVRVALASPHVKEVIVSLAEALPEFLKACADLGAVHLDAGVPNRGAQMDRGAALARGEWLLFHHADSRLTAAHLDALAAVPAPIAGGAFYRKFDERHPGLRRFESVERWHNRSFGPLYGDQSLFARRSVFEKLGGFRGLPLMEDVDFSLRLRRTGPIAMLDPAMESSPRKHLANGPWRTTLKNALLLGLFSCGVSPARLHRWYYADRIPVKK
jgi:hypothetical protein